MKYLNKLPLCFAFVSLLGLGGCLFKTDDIPFALSGGDMIPFKSRIYRFACSSLKEGVMKPDDTDQVIMLELLNDGTNRYFFKDGWEGNMVAFHHVRDDLYIAAYPNTPGNVGETVDIVEITEDSYTVLNFPTKTRESVAMKRNVTISTESMSGSVDDERAFILDLAALPKEQTLHEKECKLKR